MFIYFLFLIYYLLKGSSSITIFSKGTHHLDKNSVALQFYFSIINENQARCRVGTRFKKCCSGEKDQQDCTSMFLYGKHVQNIMPGEQETFIFIYPSVFHHDMKGVCYIEVNCNCGVKTKRKILEIDFDTRIEKLKRKPSQLKMFSGQKHIRNCDSIDEDGLNDCSPVNCEVKYTDEKPFYDVNMNKCVRAATCIGNLKDDLPTLAYLPTVNLCRDLEHSVQIQDIYAINNDMSIVTDVPKITSNLSAEIDTNCSTISQKISLLEDMFSGKMNPNPRGVQVDYSKTYEITIFSILGYIICISSFIVAFACCMHNLKSLYRKWENGEFNDMWRNMKQKVGNKVPREQKKMFRPSQSAVTNSCNVKDGLLRDVINSGIPMELRNSIVDVCERIRKEVRWKKRYRIAHMGSPFDCDRDSTISRASSGDSLKANTSNTSENETLT